MESCEIIADTLSKAGWSWGWLSMVALVLRAKHLSAEERAKTNCILTSAEIAHRFVRLDYSAAFIQHADNCPVRARPGAAFRVRDRVADSIGSCIPDRAVSKPVAD